MKVRFWGTRGSIASPGPGTSRYGGNTSCVEVRCDDGTLIVLDAGTGLRKLGETLVSDRNGARSGHVFITHTHWDHIQGFPFFVPFFTEGYEWDVYAPRGFGSSLKETLAGQMQYTYFPVDLRALGATMRYHDLVEGTLGIGPVRITAHYLNHPALTLGYRIEADGYCVVYATDHECAARGAAKLGRPLGEILNPDRLDASRYAAFIAGADLLIHDSQYTDAEYPAHKGWGHSTVEEVVDIANAAGVARLLLFHHDPNREDDAIDHILASQRARAAASRSALVIDAAAEGWEIDLGTRAAPPSQPVAQDAREAPHPSPPSRSVLIAGARAALVAPLVAICEAENLAAMVAADVPAALRIAQSSSPALCLIDLALAPEGREELGRALRDLPGGGDLPLIAVSLEEDAGSCDAGGMTDWLVAPFSEQYGRTRLRAWLLRTRTRWTRAALPHNEAARLKALHDLAVLDTPPDARLDRITRMAARLFDVPAALLTFVDAERQWCKSRFGNIPGDVPRDQSFCAHAVGSGQPMVVPDAMQDDRFADNPLVTGEHAVRFYAGYPVFAAGGPALGMLCLLDRRPRDLGASDLELLGELAALAAETFATPLAPIG